jgi:hypothetical protein
MRVALEDDEIVSAPARRYESSPIGLGLVSNIARMALMSDNRSQCIESGIDGYTVPAISLDAER